MLRPTFCILASALSGCAFLHHAQLGDIDDRHGKGERLDLKVSEMGVNLEEAGRVAKAFSKTKQASGNVNNVQSIIGAFQSGPKTGNPVYNEHYAEEILEKIMAACPSGRISGLTSIREMRKYPVLSGEIVKVTGYCTAGKGGDSEVEKVDLEDSDKLAKRGNTKRVKKAKQKRA